MDDRVKLVAGEHVSQARQIPAVHFVERHSLAGDLPDSFQDKTLRIGEIVHNDDLIACFQQFDSRMGADIAGSSRH